MASGIVDDNAEHSELIKRLRQGNEEALAELFAKYRDRMHRMIDFRLDRRLRSRTDASDVLQESYLDAVQRVNHFIKNPAIPFSVWLRLIVGQRLIEVHRRHLGAKKRDAAREISMNDVRSTFASSANIAIHLTGHLTSPSQAAINAESMFRLEEALNTMTDMDREVLVLRHFEDLSNNEVAEILSIGKTAASNRYVRALKRLKEILSEIPEFKPEAE